MKPMQNPFVKKSIVALAVAALIAGAWFGYRHFTAVRSPEQKMAYALGAQVGMNIAGQGVPVDPEALSLAVKDVLSNSKVRLTEEELNAAFRAYQEASQKKMIENADKNRRDGAAFFKANALRKEVKSLPNGLQYEVIKAGTGRKITAADTVTAQFRGTLITGAEFESSARNGRPAELRVSQLIPGLQAGLTLMNEGSIFRFFLPPELAYQEQARPGIPPFSTLIFEIEALKASQEMDSKTKKK